MSNKRAITSTFEKGMYMDTHEDMQPKGTYSYARNVIGVDAKQRQYKSNEHSNKKVITFDSKIRGRIHQDEHSRTFYLLEDESIWYQDHNTEEKHFVCKASEFGCTWEINACERLHVAVYTKGCDTYLQWSANWVYYIINVDQMLDEKRKKALIEQITDDTCRDCNKTCNYFKVFKPKCNILGEAVPYQTGGSLAAGAYSYSARLINSDGSSTSWSVPTRPKYIYSQHNIPGEESHGRIEVTFSDLDCNYDEIEIAVIYYSRFSTITRVVNSRYFSGEEYTFNHLQTEEGSPVDISEILSLNSINLEGRFQTAYSGHMYYTGIRPQKEYNIQAIASQVQVRFLVEKYPLEVAKKYQIKTLCRGESYKWGLWVNHDDGSRSYAGVLICGGGDGDTGGATSANATINPDPVSTIPDTSESGGEETSTTFGDITQTQKPELERDRGVQPDSVQEPLQADELMNIQKALVDSYETDIQDLVDNIDAVEDASALVDGACTDCPDEDNQFMKSRKDNKDSDIVEKDIATAEDIAVKWGSILGDLIGDEGKKDLIKSFTPSTIKEAAQGIIDAIKHREVIVIQKAKYTLTKNVTYDNGDSNNQSFESETPDGETPILNNGPTYPGGTVIGYYEPECTIEEDTTYPCMIDCEGNPIFGSNAGAQIRNFKVPDENTIGYYDSKSIGVPSRLTPDADEYRDGYVIVIGPSFSNINIDREDYYNVTGKRVCPNNPFTIGEVELNDHNKTIMTKLAVAGGFLSSNQGKQYIYQNLGANSFEKCDAHIDVGDGVRMDPGAQPANAMFGYSLDQASLEPNLGNASTLTLYRNLSGIGRRHNLYAPGFDPSNKLNGRRVDVTGTIQSVNINQQENTSTEITFSGYKYVTANDVHAPVSGSSIPLNNKYNQACLWLSTNTPITIRDKSFVGDVLNHEAPITDAQLNYAVISRELANQYGPIENLSYRAILQGRGDSTSVEGLTGDRYISPYSFVKTSLVSDKVGNKFPISQWDDSKSDRCICDNPADAIEELRGGWFWTSLPKDSDKADAKNWAGLHTPEEGRTREWADANSQDQTESDFYYPGTLTTLITIWGESETNPWGVEISDELEKQRYPFITSKYELGANIPEPKPWDDTLLDGNFHIKRKQPSYAEKISALLMESLINIILPTLGLGNLIVNETGLELTGDIVAFPMMLAVWLLGTKVLFTKQFIYDFIGIPLCKTDDEGGIDFTVERFFTNWNQYSSIFHKEQEIVSVPQMREPQICCTNLLSYDNSIYRSDPMIETSVYNGYTHVRPNNFHLLSQDKGQITDLFQLNGSLYGNLTDGMYSLVVPQIRFSTDGLPLISGQGNIFNPQLIIGSNPEGYAGLLNRNHAINCQLGRFQLDYKAGILYHFTGKDLDPISLKGMYSFFKRYSQYCESADCENEMLDNHYSLGYDPRLQRVLITKNEGDNSWTVSYDPVAKAWVSFHDYIPIDYINTREKYYHLTDTEVWVHTPDKEYTYGNFFGKQYSSILDVKTTDGSYVHYLSHLINTEAQVITEESTKYAQTIPIDTLGFHNARQTAGYQELVGTTKRNAPIPRNIDDKIFKIRATHVTDIWRVNELYDYTINHDNALLTQPNKCLPFTELTNAVDCSERTQQRYKERLLVGKWFTSRLEFKNVKKNVKLYFKSLSLLVQNKNE